VLHGNRTYVLQDDNGQVTETHSVSAGLDYPGVGPEHAFLADIGRAEYVGITDKEALDAFHYLCRTEGIIPALESSHAVAYAMKLAKTMRPDQVHSGEPVRTWRQGHRHRRRSEQCRLLLPPQLPWPIRQRWRTTRAVGQSRRCSMSRIAATSDQPEGPRPQGAHSLRHRWLPLCRRHCRARCTPWSRAARGCDRAGRALLGPQRRRPHHPEGGRQGFSFRHRHGAGHGHGARVPQSQQHHSRGAHGLCQPGGAL